MTFELWCSLNGVLNVRPVADGKIRRYPTEAHPRKRNGAAMLRADGQSGWCKAFDMGSITQYWRADGREFSQLTEEERDHIKALAEQERKALEASRKEAAKRACAMLNAATLSTHPYLARKGFPSHPGLVLNGELLIPMRDSRNYRCVLSAQRIAPDGAKLFVKGGQAAYACFVLGGGDDLILCEGYATALSIMAALKSLYRQARVAVCFSAGNIPAVARTLQAERKVVVADHDRSGTGQIAAEQTGLKWWMPEEIGADYNDIYSGTQDDACKRKAVMALSTLLTESV